MQRAMFAPVRAAAEKALAYMGLTAGTPLRDIGDVGGFGDLTRSDVRLYTGDFTGDGRIDRADVRALSARDAAFAAMHEVSGPVVAIVLLAASRLPMDAAGSVAAVAINVVTIARWVFFVQGIAVFADVKKKHSAHALTADVGLAETSLAGEPGKDSLETV